MSDADGPSTRLHVPGPLVPGERVLLDADRTHRLRSVLRFDAGDPLLVFDGASGEFAARFAPVGKRDGAVLIERMTRPQPPAGDLRLLFAPLKHARLDYMVQKAVEMGASRLQPVITRRTQVARVNRERMAANAIEAAEQCGVLSLPEVMAEAPLDAVLEGWDPARRLVFCDERAALADPLAALQRLARGPLAVLIGPEGGFSPDEALRLRSLPFVTGIALGPRVMRADTAAVAALAIVQAALGDWS